MNIHSTYFAPEEAERIETAVRHGIPPEAVARIGRVDISPAHPDARTIEIAFSIRGRGECRMRFLKDEQSAEEIEQRVRERFVDL